MPKPQKIEAVAELKEKLQQSDGALLAAFRGLKVQEMKELRRSLAPSGTEFKVVKNTLARLAVKEASLDDLLPLLEGSTAIAFIKGDPVAAAKSLDDIAKKYPTLEIKGGFIEGRVLDAARASALAKVKPREVLLAQLAGMFQQPLQQLANLMSAPLQKMAYALGAYKEKIEKESAPPEPAPAVAEPAAAAVAEPPAAEPTAGAEAQPTDVEAPADMEPSAAAEPEPSAEESQGAEPEAQPTDVEAPADVEPSAAAEPEPSAAETQGAESEASTDTEHPDETSSQDKEE